MSLDKSLVTKGRLARHRNVLSRWERIERLEEEGKWSQGDSVFALPKVRNIRMKRSKGKAEKEEAAPEAAEVTAEAAEAAATEGAEAAETSKDEKSAGEEKGKTAKGEK